MAKPIRKMVDFYRLVTLLKWIKPHLVVANTLINSTTVMAALWVGSRVVVWAHEVQGMINDPWRIRSFWIRRAHKVLGVSQEVCAFLRKMKIEPGKIGLLHHGLDLEKVRNHFRFKEINPKRLQETLVLGALAIWSPRKRLDLLLETAYAVAHSKRFQEVRVDIGGPIDPGYPQLLKTTLDCLPAPPQNLIVRFLGPIEDQDVFF